MEPNREGTCRWCKKRFIRGSKHHKSEDLLLFCSQQCSGRAAGQKRQERRRLPPPHRKICPVCHVRFQPNNWVQQTCSIKCGHVLQGVIKRRNSEARKAQMEVPKTITIKRKSWTELVQEK